MTAQTPMTPSAVFEGQDFRTNEGRTGCRFYFDGHLTADQIEAAYFTLWPEHRTEYPYTVAQDSIRPSWHVFTEHEDTCYLIAAADPDDPFEPDDYRDATFCSCEAGPGLDDGSGYEYRHPHPAAGDTPGAIPVTWVTIERT